MFFLPCFPPSRVIDQLNDLNLGASFSSTSAAVTVRGGTGGVKGDFGMGGGGKCREGERWGWGGGGQWAGEVLAGGARDLNQTDSETSHQSQTACTLLALCTGAA